MQKMQSKATYQPASLPDRQPTTEGTRQTGTCKQQGQPPTSETTSEQAREEASEPASKPAKQPGHQPASQRTKQPASQTQANNKQKHRQTGRQTQQYSQQSMDSAGSTACLQPIASTKEFHFERPLGSKCKGCFKERKHELKQ